jgi:hypothetical protein
VYPNPLPHHYEYTDSEEQIAKLFFAFFLSLSLWVDTVHETRDRTRFDSYSPNPNVENALDSKHPYEALR